MRIGFGYDVHALTSDRPLIVGGVCIPHNKGAQGHSDADVLIHAIIDSLLGAAGMRDIGYHFPDSDPQYKNADSKILLKKTITMLHEGGYTIGNIDCTVSLQSPKISPYVPQMLDVLCEVMQISKNRLSIKAKTSEHLGFIGRGEGIAAHAVALVKGRS